MKRTGTLPNALECEMLLLQLSKKIGITYTDARKLYGLYTIEKINEVLNR